MNRKQMIKAMAEASGLSVEQSGKALTSFIDVLKEELSNGGSLTLVGFGTFLTKQTQERQGRKPSTGEVITIPASVKVKFQAGKSLKDAVNNTETQEA